MTKAYQVYPNRSRKRAELQVRINRQGNFAFNAEASKILEVGKVRYLLLLWDASTRSVAFRVVDGDEPEAFKLRGVRSQKDVYAKDFLLDIGWDMNVSLALRASWNEAEKTLELEPLPERKAETS